MRARGIGLGALLVVFVGAVEGTWLLAGPGWSLLMRAAHRVWGLG